MGESRERIFEIQKKMTKIREELSKKEMDIKRKLADTEKIKVEASKRTEEMKYSAHHEMEKIDQLILKTRDLEAQTKDRIASEIATLKSYVENKYNELKNSISGKSTSS